MGSRLKPSKPWDVEAFATYGAVAGALLAVLHIAHHMIFLDAATPDYNLFGHMILEGIILMVGTAIVSAVIATVWNRVMRGSSA